MYYDFPMPSKKYHHGDLKNSLVQAGMELLSQQGVEALSLRQVASRVGVSHSAPYAHFNDKQDLIAAISAEGFRLLYERIAAVAQSSKAGSAGRLLETAWAYVTFALENRACFKLMFSGILEKEQDYPEFIEISQACFLQLVELVGYCQHENVLQPGDNDIMAVSLWSLVHGFVSLLLEKQISHTILEKTALRQLLCRVLNPITMVELPQE